MNTLVVVDNVDITPWIVPDSYKLVPTEAYESWQDGNYVEHRVYTRTRMTGTFNVWTAEPRGMDTDALMEHFTNATHNKVTTMGVYDNVENRMRAIEAYCHITPDKHKDLAGGKFYDVFKIEVYER